MIANFNQCTDAAASKTQIWNVRAHYHEAPRGSLVERVCSFLDRYPLSHADDDEGVASSGLRPSNSGSWIGR